ncbi:hypothetical protein CgunFtcFv8_001763 [Champsocephalus gunnari]|uniref:Uncharacterized protein n=1 Tax=Champsocephalus gunnari TaxID=52237 RepID=A0AAN8CL74_CHAGU|nr:hypothetical protein CgunFtcFv8_001763 [Champsocephalus gunnari]
MDRHFDFGDGTSRRCQQKMGSVIVAAARGHRSVYELSHCVIPKELSPAAARQHVPRMWALDPAQLAS